MIPRTPEGDIDYRERYENFDVPDDYREVDLLDYDDGSHGLTLEDVTGQVDDEAR